MGAASLLDFQMDAIRRGAEPLGACLEHIRQARSVAPDQVDAFRREQGGLLIDAPIGIGKTLIAGGIAQALSANHRILWMWFAPFSGIVEQTAGVLGRECPPLRPLRLPNDLAIENVSSGAVFVTTWAGVVGGGQGQRRKAMEDDEERPSIQSLLEFARGQDFEIGAVIDEAHHGFRRGTEAFRFCLEVLKPTVSIMATATPRKDELKPMLSALGVKRFSEISISRETGVEGNLLKRGVKAALFRATSVSKDTVDFDRLALREAVREHEEVKRVLQKASINISPLLMVQANSEGDSVNKAKAALVEFGVPERAIRIHTANEPDPEFFRISEDESVEALVFKMAAATGFDAPRAFVLASLRTIRDAQFGLQIIGRIMRKHRAHQAAPKAPKYLDYGYVFLADPISQEGLRRAAEQINQVRDQINPLTREMGIFVIGDAPQVRKTPGGAVSIFAGEPDDEESPANAPEEDERPDEDGEERRPTEPEPLIVLPDDKPRQVKTGDGRTAEMWRSGEYKYPLRGISGLPRRLQTAIFNTDKASSLTRDVVDQFMLNDARIMQLAHRQAAQVCRETLEIFQQVYQPPQILSADLAMAELRRMAQRKFGGDVDGHGYLQEREFRRLMRDRLRGLADKSGWTDMTDKLVEEWMIKILAFEPRAMKQAISRVIAANLTTRETDAPLPKFLRSEVSLIPARHNIYGVYPPDMNGWERRFAEMLDADDGVVLWWHRNTDRKKWAVRIPIPGSQGGYYPDFVVGVRDRSEDGILLVETKRDINDYKGNAAAKARSLHPLYGRVLMLLLDEDANEWQIVEPDERTEGNTTIPGFHLEMMRGY